MTTRATAAVPITAAAIGALLVSLLLAAPAWSQLPPGGSFTDDNGNLHEGNIEAVFAAEITLGCAPARFCPTQAVTRGQMAAFISRARSLSAASADFFSDDEGSEFEDAINRLAASGITNGCRPGNFCPDRLVSRQEMAAFLVRAYGYSGGGGENTFKDDNGSPFEADIEALAAAGVTKGCAAGLFCPFGAVLRDQMASFIARAQGLQPIVPPPPAMPAEGVPVNPGANLADLVSSSPAGTTFVLMPGVHARQRVVPKDGNSFVGQPGAVMSGEGVTDFAFTGSAKNVTIAGLVIENYANPASRGAIDGRGTGWVIEKNEIRNNTGAGLYIESGFRVIGNNIHHNRQIGILAKGTGALIEGNEIAFNNYQAAYQPGWEAGGTKFMGTSNLVVRNNNVHDNHGPGLWTDNNNIGTVYEGNTVINNYGPGIMHEISYDAVIRNNWVEGNAHGFYVGGILVTSSPNVEVYGNTLAGNDGGIIAIQDNRGSGAYGAHEVRNFWVHDNTVAFTGGWNGVRLNAGSAEIYTTWNNRYDRNTYQVGSLSKPFFWQGTQRTKTEWINYGQDTNAIWR